MNGYLWPPRPDIAITPHQFSVYEKQGWVAQVKKNGTLAVITIRPDGQIVMMNRHEDNLKWTMPRETAEFLKLKFGPNGHILGETVLIAELLHFKTKQTKNTLYIFDILVSNGESLVGQTLSYRQNLLTSLLTPQTSKITGTSITIIPGLELAISVATGFNSLFSSLVGDDNEGIVLKNPQAVLKSCHKQGTNSGWQVKCRLPKKNFAF